MTGVISSATHGAATRGAATRGAAESASRPSPAWAALPAGPELAAALAATEISALDDHDLVELVAATERLSSWTASVQLAAMAEFARRPLRAQLPDDDPVALAATYAPPGRWVREHADDELAAALRLTRRCVANRIGLGCALRVLPRTAAALSSGAIDAARAQVIGDETAVLDRESAREVERDLADRATRSSLRRLRERARAAVLAVDPDAAHRRHVDARAERRVVITPISDGMAELWARLTAQEAVAIDATLNACARASSSRTDPGEARTMDQRRADALVAPFSRALVERVLRPVGVDGSPATHSSDAAGRDRVADSSASAGMDRAAHSSDAADRDRVPHRDEASGLRLAGRGGQPAEILVTVAASTLLGHDDDPATLHGYGPVTAEVARDLATDARWRRVLTDPAGAVVEVGPTTYRPSASLARLVTTRNPCCSFPGCSWPARSCDLDHAVPFPKGETTAANIGPVCPRHHRFKHSGAVRVVQEPDGTRIWTLPAGHQYVVPPPLIGEPPPPDTDPPARAVPSTAIGAPGDPAVESEPVDDTAAAEPPPVGPSGAGPPF